MHFLWDEEMLHVVLKNQLFNSWDFPFINASYMYYWVN